MKPAMNGKKKTYDKARREKLINGKGKLMIKQEQKT